MMNNARVINFYIKCVISARVVKNCPNHPFHFCPHSAPHLMRSSSTSSTYHQRAWPSATGILVAKRTSPLPFIQPQRPRYGALRSCLWGSSSGNTWDSSYEILIGPGHICCHRKEPLSFRELFHRMFEIQPWVSQPQLAKIGITNTGFKSGTTISIKKRRLRFTSHKKHQMTKHVELGSDLVDLVARSSG